MLVSLKYSRNCPSCNKVLFYKRKYTRDVANKNDWKCKSCTNTKYLSGRNNGMFGRKQTTESNKKRSDSLKGRVSPMKGRLQSYSARLKISNSLKGKPRPDNVKEKIRKSLRGRVFSEEHRQNLSDSIKKIVSGKENPMFGKKHRPETIEKMKKPHLSMCGNNNPSVRPEVRKKLRLKQLERIENIYGDAKVAFNPIACQIIDEYGKKRGYKFQHAMNGGERRFSDLGYWADGYDTKTKTVIEYQEKRHLYAKQRLHDDIKRNDILNHPDCDKYIELFYDGRVVIHE